MHLYPYKGKLGLKKVSLYFFNSHRGMKIYHIRILVFTNVALLYEICHISDINMEFNMTLC